MSARRRGRARGRGGDEGQQGRGSTPTRGRVTPFDGPASRGSGSAAGSQSRASAPPSQAGTLPPASDTPSSSQQTVPAAPRDPAREGAAPRATDALKNIDMPASFYNIDGLYSLPTDFAKRNNNFNKTGKVIGLPLNTYQVLSTPSKVIYQYDVIIGNGTEKRAVQTKAWQSRKRVEATGNDLIYDGNKLAWSLTDYNQVKLMVDLDQEQGRGPSKDGKNAFRVHINKTKRLDLSAISSYLQGKIQYNINVMEAMNFLDHLLREGPSRNPRLVPVRRSFFARDGARADLGGGVEVFRGVYQSIRVAEGGKLTVNLDVANSCFWRPQGLMATIVNRNKYRDPYEIAHRFQTSAEVRATNAYARKLSVKAVYQGNRRPNTVWQVKCIADVNAQTHRLTWRNEKGEDTGEKVTVAAYFKRKYNVQLVYPNLPLIEMTKKMRGEPIYFPMELLVITENQRYGAKLDELQTASMIKFAVAPPNTRMQAINEGKSWLSWQNDKWLQEYGLAIDQQQTVTQARILPPPGITFGANKIESPGTKGRWDLRAKKFFSGNPKQLVSWGIGLFTRGRTKLGKGEIEKFAQDFMKQYRGHGGDVANGLPNIMQVNDDPAQAVADLFQSTGNKFNLRPQLLIFLVQDKNAHHYLRIKKSCDCRFGVVSQVMQAAQVQKGNPQYYSNVLMKVNAKLGGCTSKVAPAVPSGFKGFSIPTVFIGADVSHASPGSEQPSMAAMTVSLDKHAGRYAAACQTNGHRVEMITQANIRSLLGPLLQHWSTDIGGGRPPQQVFYMRDGVSEGQFLQVVQEEIPAIRAILDQVSGGKWEGKITAIVAAKRHHIRAFPRQGDGDAKGNPLPGTLIERDVTMPLEFDFYLYSHIALQGTSRPVHYTVLIDEANHPASVLQNMIYEHCYQYMRSTTSVSLHPAVYYAHLASNRAKSHEDVPASAGPTGGPGFKQNQPYSSSTPKSSGSTPLLPLHPTGNIQYTMWYI